jgi:hypothetical protein
MKTFSAVAFGLAVAGTVLISRPASAGNDPCGADRAKFCKGVKVGKPMRECLNRHHNDLSQVCKDAMVVHPKNPTTTNVPAPAPAHS